MAKMIVIVIMCCSVSMALGRSSSSSSRTTDEDSNASQAEKPHIVLVISDDHGYHDASYTGSMIKTPVLDSLVEQGVRLENYYVQPQCTPSRSQLLSGRYQIHTGLQHRVIGTSRPNGLPLTVPGSLNEPLPTLPDLLKEQGYATHGAGKWHLGHFQKAYTPLHRGFDSYIGIYPGEADHYDYTRGCRRGGSDIGLCLVDNNEIVRDKNGTYSTWLYTDRAKDVIHKHSAHHSEQPLFLYVSYQTVHSPLQAPDSYIDQYDGVFSDTVRQIKAAMVTAMDDGIGQIVDTLKEKEMWTNTLLLFTSDNGAQDGQGGKNYPFRGWKRSHFEGGIRGLGIVTCPTLLAGREGTTSTGMIHISDWYPTLVHLAGGSVEYMGLDGMDVWDTISDGAASPRTEILHNINPLERRVGVPLFDDTFDSSVHAAIRVGPWKLITGYPGPDGISKPDPDEVGGVSIPYEQSFENVLLFNIDDDPYETNDLSEELMHVVRALLDRLKMYNATAVEVWYPESDPTACPKFHNGTFVPWLDP